MADLTKGFNADSSHVIDEALHAETIKQIQFSCRLLREKEGIKLSHLNSLR